MDIHIIYHFIDYKCWSQYVMHIYLFIRSHTLLTSSNFHLTHSTGRPFSHSIKHARLLVVTTISQAACSSLGSATIRVGSPPTRHESMSGMPCRTCNHTVPIHQSFSLMCKCSLLFSTCFFHLALIHCTCYYIYCIANIYKMSFYVIYLCLSW